MDAPDSTRSLWLSGDAMGPPRERLREVVAALVRARHLQLLVDHGFGGLLAGLVLAAIVVLTSRLMGLPYAPFELTAATLIIALPAALLVGWRRRPDALDVAIRADVALRLKERLSTAWEYMAVRDDAALAEPLAAQAVKARLPARPRMVFPLRVNRWGRLAPVAATAVLLVSVLDVTRMQAPALRHIDERVVDEGQRLGALGREMQARAAREDLPRTAKQAEQLERLGARMESGALSRRESLGLLRQLGVSLEKEGRQALAGADRRPTDATGAPEKSPAGQIETPERTPGGVRLGEDSRALSKYLSDLARSGAPRQELDDASQRSQAADSREVRAMLENMAQIDRARREQEELQNALSQVRQAQENLGENLAGTLGGRGVPTDDDEGDEQDGDRTVGKAGDRRQAGETRGASRFGSQSDSSFAAERQPVPVLPDPRKSGPILKPQSDVREGESLVTHGQVLPRANRPSVENVQMRAEFAQQVEEVLSKEQYSAQSKEIIRRYFLSLSQGGRGGQQQSGSAQ